MDKMIANTLLEAMNNYVELYKAGNNNVLVAIGNIAEALKNMGYQVIVTANGYTIK